MKPDTHFTYLPEEQNVSDQYQQLPKPAIPAALTSQVLASAKAQASEHGKRHNKAWYKHPALGVAASILVVTVLLVDFQPASIEPPEGVPTGRLPSADSLLQQAPVLQTQVRKRQLSAPREAASLPGVRSILQDAPETVVSLTESEEVIRADQIEQTAFAQQNQQDMEDLARQSNGIMASQQARVPAAALEAPAFLDTEQLGKLLAILQNRQASNTAKTAANKQLFAMLLAFRQQSDGHIPEKYVLFLSDQQRLALGKVND